MNSLLRKNKNKIPQGLYCYDKNGICPYWRLLKDRPEQYDGWCDYLGKGDIEIAKEMILKSKRMKDKTIKTMRGDEAPFPVSLLWDQCKECGINEWDEV